MSLNKGKGRLLWAVFPLKREYWFFFDSLVFILGERREVGTNSSLPKTWSGSRIPTSKTDFPTFPSLLTSLSLPLTLSHPSFPIFFFYILWNRNAISLPLCFPSLSYLHFHTSLDIYWFGRFLPFPFKPIISSPHSISDMAGIIISPLFSFVSFFLSLPLACSLTLPIILSPFSLSLTFLPSINSLPFLLVLRGAPVLPHRLSTLRPRVPTILPYFPPSISRSLSLTFLSPILSPFHFSFDIH